MSGIYLGQIKKWNDPKIAALNEGAKLPPADIAAVNRSDGSGTSFIFTSYLAAVSPGWKSAVGSGLRLLPAASGMGVLVATMMARQIKAHRRAVADFGIDADVATGLAGKSVDHR